MSERDRGQDMPEAWRSKLASVLADEKASKPPSDADLAKQRELRQTWMDAALAVAPLRSVEFIMMNPSTESLALELVKTWLKVPRAPHLLLRGGTGTTKTVAAGWLVRHCTEPDHNRGTVSWLYPDDVVSAMMHGYDDKAPKLAKYVVIDEIGTESRPEFPIALGRLLDRARCHVLMTTNLDTKAFVTRYMDGPKNRRLRDRLEAFVEVYDIPGESKRPRVGDF